MFSKTDVEKYFTAEKNTCLLFMAIGAMAVIAAIVLFFWLKTDFCKGASIPLVLIGLLQLIASVSVYNRSDAQRKDIVYKLDMNPSAIKEKELPRIETAIGHLNGFLWVEVGLLVAGVALVIIYKNNHEKVFWCGLGVALALQAAITFGADLLAADRVKKYMEGLKAYTSKPMHP